MTMRPSEWAEKIESTGMSTSDWPWCERDLDDPPVVPRVADLRWCRDFVKACRFRGTVASFAAWLKNMPDHVSKLKKCSTSQMTDLESRPFTQSMNLPNPKPPS